MSDLPHAEHIEKLLRAGKKKEAQKAHNDHLAAQFKKAQQGEIINLSDLMAGKEAFIIDEIESK